MKRRRIIEQNRIAKKLRRLRNRKKKKKEIKQKPKKKSIFSFIPSNLSRFNPFRR